MEFGVLNVFMRALTMKIKITPVDRLPCFDKFEYDLGIQAACLDCGNSFKEGEITVLDVDGRWCWDCYMKIPVPENHIQDWLDSLFPKDKI